MKRTVQTLVSILLLLLMLLPSVPVVASTSTNANPTYDLKVTVTGGKAKILLTIYSVNTQSLVFKKVIGPTTYLNLPEGMYYFYALPLNSNVKIFPQSGYVLVPLGGIRLYEVYEPQFTQHVKSTPKIASFPIDYVTAINAYYAGPCDYVVLGTNTSELVVAKYFYHNSSFVVAWGYKGFVGKITAVAITKDYTAAAVYFNGSTKIYAFYTDNGSLITVVNQTVIVQHHGCLLDYYCWIPSSNPPPIPSPNENSSPYESIPYVFSIAVSSDKVYATLPTFPFEIVYANISPTSHIACPVLSAYVGLNPTVGIRGISRSFAVTYNDTIYALYANLSYPSCYLQVFTIPNLSLNLKYNLTDIASLLSISVPNSTFTVDEKGNVFVGIKNVTFTFSPKSSTPAAATTFLIGLTKEGSFAVRLPLSTRPPLVTPSSNGVVAYVNGTLYDVDLTGQVVWSKSITDVRAITSSLNGQVIAVLNGSGTNWDLLEFNSGGQLVAEVKEIGQGVYPLAQLGVGINGGQNFPLIMDPYNEVVFLSTSEYLYGIPVGVNATISNGRIITPVTVNISEVPPYSGVVQVTYKGQSYTTTTNTSIKVFPGTITLYATPYSNSTFQYWAVNGSTYTENPLTVNVMGNTVVTAVFRTQINVTFEAIGLTDTYWFVNVSGQTYTTSSPSMTIALKPGVNYTAGLLTFNNLTVTVFRGEVNSQLITLNFTDYFKPILSCLNLVTPVFNVTDYVMTKGYWENFTTNYAQSIYYYALLMNDSYKLFNGSPQFYSYLQMVVNNPVLPYYTGAVNVGPFINNISPLLSFNTSKLTQMLDEEDEALSQGNFRAYTEVKSAVSADLTDLMTLLNKNNYGEIAGQSLLSPSDVQTLIPYLAFRNSLIAVFNATAFMLKSPAVLNMTTVYWFPTVLNASIRDESLVAELYVPPYYSFNGVAQVQQFYSIPVTDLYYNLTTQKTYVPIGSVQVPLNLTAPYSRIVGYKVLFVNATVVDPVFTQVLDHYKVISLLNLSDYDYFFQHFVGEALTTEVNLTPTAVKIPFVKITLNSTPLSIAQLYLNTSPLVVMYNYVASEVKGAEYVKSLNNLYFIIPNVSESYLVAGSPQRVNLSLLKIPYNLSFSGTLQRSIAFLKLNDSYVGYATQAKVELNSQSNISELAIKSPVASYVFLLNNLTQLQVVGVPTGQYTIQAQTPQGVINSTVSVSSSDEVISVRLTPHQMVTASPIITSNQGLPLLQIAVIVVLVVALVVVLTLLKRR
ncbi:hypothetical protein [Stygiolobus caldivivus]|uniref:Bacterial repeat domain-containing protein n=1 Tax=Stygiolobus caldivivus TaxID=2824673 RepID=A0A8D5ZJB4_9CREN|nr:hypothetical protein [Stygiolobus caldivivus]BCU69992.1 hypothetical protein KN1_12890 [Stygiolobus caldivivus]